MDDAWLVIPCHNSHLLPEPLAKYHTLTPSPSTTPLHRPCMLLVLAVVAAVHVRPGPGLPERPGIASAVSQHASRRQHRATDGSANQECGGSVVYSRLGIVLLTCSLCHCYSILQVGVAAHSRWLVQSGTCSALHGLLMLQHTAM